MTSAATGPVASAPGASGSKELAAVRHLLDRINAYDWEAVSSRAPDRLTSALTSLWLGNPNFHISVEWMVAHDDRVTLWAHGTGTHTRDWHLPPAMGPLAGRKLLSTGTSWRVPWSVTLRVRRERIADVWGVWDWLSILTQLGVVRVTTGSRSCPPA